MKSDLQPDLPSVCEKFGLSDDVRRHLGILVNMLRAAEELDQGFQLPRVLLFGNPGIDKMQIAAALSAASGKPLVAAHARELKSMVEGESSERVRQLFERAYAQAPCLLFIEDIDLVAAKRGSPNDNERTTEIVRELLFQIKSPPTRHILLAAAAEEPDDLDPAVQTKFGTKVDLWRPWQNLVLRPSVKEQLLGVLHSIQSGAGSFNTLIFGPPGTAKSAMVRDLAKISGLRWFSAGALDFRGGYVGQSASRVREVFEKVRNNAPAILFIDLEQGPYSDDCLLPPRSSHESDFFTHERVCEVLAQMDFLHRKQPPVFIIGETFHVDRVDPAVVSRFKVRIEIALPDESERRQILEQMIRTSRLSDAGLDVDEISAHLARSLAAASGRDLDHVVRTGINHALNRSSDRDRVQLTRQDLMAAAQESRMYATD